MRNLNRFEVIPVAIALTFSACSGAEQNDASFSATTAEASPELGTDDILSQDATPPAATDNIPGRRADEYTNDPSLKTPQPNVQPNATLPIPSDNQNPLFGGETTPTLSEANIPDNPELWERWGVSILDLVDLDGLEIGESYCAVNTEYGPISQFTVTGNPTGYSELSSSNGSSAEDDLADSVVIPAKGVHIVIGDFDDFIFASDNGLSPSGYALGSELSQPSTRWNRVNRTFSGVCPDIEANATITY